MASQFIPSAPFGVNPVTAGSQEAPAVLVFGSGRYLLAWEDDYEAPLDTRYLNARFYNSDGSASGTAFRLNSLPALPQSAIALTALGSGSFVAAWSGRSSADGSDYDIRARIFDDAGDPVGPEFTVNLTHTANVQLDPSVTLLANGNFVVTWTNGSGLDGVGPDLMSTSVMAQIFTPAGTRVGSEFLINPNPEGAQQESKVVALAGGGFAVVWTDSSGLYGDGDTGIVAQLFSDDGGRAGPAFLVNTATGNGQISPAVAALPDGGFVVTWQDDSGAGDAGASGIKAQLFDGHGSRVGGEMLVNSSTPGVQSAPAVTALAGGGFLIAWGDFASRESGAEVFGQYFDDSGNKVGPEVSLTDSTAGTQERPALGALPDGSFVLAYSDEADPPGPSSLDEASVTGRQFAIQRSGFSSVGDWRPDVIRGELEDDFLDGRGGLDQIYGEAGDDLLRGGENNDMLDAGAGSDLLFGEGGDDALIARGGGDDRLFGGAGADGLVVEIVNGNPLSTSLLHGGAGDDRLTFVSSRFTDSARLIGGYGNDNFFIQRGGDVTVDAGAGADSVDLSILGGTYRITLGSGRDLLTPYGGGPIVVGGSILVADFDTGASGDRLELGEYLPRSLENWDFSTNPFSTGHLRLVQDGADSVLQVDRDGSGNFFGFVDFIRFAGSNVGAFTQSNLGGFPGDGSAAVPLELEGTAGADILWGDGGDDEIRGGADDDRIDGGIGDDRIEGGDGDDALLGSYGDNLLLGGEGDDRLVGPGNGNDRMFGEAGNDYINMARVTPGGEDLSLLLDGGTGDDTLYFFAVGRYRDFVTVNGGDGREDIMIDGGKDIVVDAGAGSDSIRIDFVGETYRVTLGGGADRLTIGGNSYGATNRPAFTVTDFSAGAAATETDQLFLRGYLAGALSGWDRSADPFTSGHLRLVQSASDAVLLLDPDGSAGGGEAYEFFRFQNLDGAALTAYNLDGLKAPAVYGTGGSETLRGSALDDRLEAGAGNDQLLLQTGGNDQAFGGDGNDWFLFGSALTGADVIDGGEGRDELTLQGDYSGGLTLGEFTSVEVMVLLPGNDVRFGAPGNQLYSYSITTTDEDVASGVQLSVDANRLRAGENLVFDGSAETDGSFYIFAGKGIDTLTGGAKNDAFLFRGPGNFTGADTVNGGAGFDELALRGDYTGAHKVVFGATTISSIEAIVVVSGHDLRYGKFAGDYSFDLTMDEANVQSGQVMIVDAGTLRSGERLVFDGSAETDGGRFTMFGGQGNDTLTGGSGSDSIRGGLGADAMKGNGGADTFVYRNTADSANGAADHILDFVSGTDKIDLTRIDANSLAAGNQEFNWIGSNAFSGSGASSAGQLRAYQDGASWFVEGDTNGDGTADLIIQVTGGALTQGDFLP